MPKDLAVMPRLFDLYGGLLTERQRELFALSYHHDLTLAEIAEEALISRQAARDAVAHAEEALRGYEEVLGFYARSVAFRNTAADAVRAVRALYPEDPRLDAPLAALERVAGALIADALTADALTADTPLGDDHGI